MLLVKLSLESHPYLRVCFGRVTVYDQATTGRHKSLGEMPSMAQAATAIGGDRKWYRGQFTPVAWKLLSGSEPHYCLTA